MSTLASILANAGGAEEPSKTAFYAAGALLAGWAVLVSLVGIKRPGFPARAASRAIMLVTAVLVLGAASTAVVTA